MKKIYMKLSSNSIYFILFLIILTLLSSINLFHKGILFSHDVNFHLHRVMALVDNIKIGKILPVYFNYLNGFGYGNGLFYPDLFLYIPALLNYLGLKFELTYKFFIVIINLCTILSAYICVSKITGKKSCAYTSMILYAFSTYRLSDMIDRAALGELLSFVFLPLVVLGMYQILYGEYKNSYYLTIGLCGICFSHVISLYLTCWFIILFIVFNIECLKNKNRLFQLIAQICLSLTITSYFWIPMLEQISEIEFLFAHQINNINTVPFISIFFDLPQFNIFDGYFPSGIGFCYFIIVLNYYKQMKTNRFAFCLMILSALSIIFCCSKILWNNRIFNFLFQIIQYPWRFYMFTTVFIIISVTVIFENINKKFIIYVVTVFIINLLIYHFSGIYQTFSNDDNFNFQIVGGEYLPKEFNLDLLYNYQNKDIDYYRDNEKTFVSIKNSVDSVELPLIYYKGYSACDSDKCYDTYKTENGLVGVNIDKNVTNLEVSYTGTKLYKVSKLISIFGIILFIIYVRRYRGMIVNEKNIHET